LRRFFSKKRLLPFDPSERGRGSLTTQRNLILHRNVWETNRMRDTYNAWQWRGRFGFFGLAAILAACLPAAARAQSSVWNGYAGSSQVQLNYAPSSGSSGLHLLGAAITEGSQSLSNTINVSQSDGDAWTVDTGSEGMVITADYLEKEFGINALSFNQPSTQKIEYTSDDQTYYGFFQNLNVGLYSTDAQGHGTLAATSAQMPVFIATSLVNANGTTSFTNCLPNCSIVGGSLEQMGVGFGRGFPGNVPLAAGEPPPQNKDPLINLTSISSGSLATMAPGYVISSTGITLGLTAAALDDTDMEKLLPVPITGDGGGGPYQEAATASEWQTPAMTLKVSNAAVNGTYYGSVLVDTGLINIELQTGATQSPGLQYDAADPAKSSSLQVFLPGLASGSGQPLAYTLLFQGDCPGSVENTCPPYQNPSVGLSPIYPSNSHNQTTTGIDYVGSSTPSPAFLNTGGNFLNYFNVVYDPVSGFFGYQLAADPKMSQSNPMLNADLALQGGVSIPGGTDVSEPVFLFEEFADGDSPLPEVQLSSAGKVKISSVISSALYCANGLCTSTGLEITGGAFTLAGKNDYLGPTLLDPGASLALSGDGGIGDSSSLTDNGAFDISAATDGASIASLSGSGTVALGGKTLTLYDASGSFSGAISGTCQLAVTGGTEELLGASLYTGGTTISGGATVIAGNQAALGSSQGPLNLNDGAVQLQSNLDTGPLTVASGGGAIGSNGFTTMVTGPVTIGGAFWLSGPLQATGQVSINSGATAIDGELLAPSLQVAAGASLSGTGMIAAPAAIAGTLAPGDDPGTLTFAAPVTLQAGATSIFDIDGTGTGSGAGNYSRIVVLAPATYTAGGQLQPVLRGITGSATNRFSPKLGQSFAIVSAPGGVLGSYSGLTQPAGLAANTRFDVLYGPTTINLVTTPASYAAFAQSFLADPNESAIAQALDATRPLAGAMMASQAGQPEGAAMTASQAAVFEPLYPLNAAQLPLALNQLSPQIAADSVLVNRNGWLLANGSIEDELRAERGLAAGSQSQSTRLASGRTLWFSGIGQTANLDAGQVPGFNSSLSGFIAGADMPVLPALTAGLAVGYENTSANTETAGKLSGDGVQLAAYADYRLGRAFRDAQIGGSLYEAGTQQYLAASGVAVAGHNTGNAIGGAVTGGLDLTFGGWQAEPSLSLIEAAIHQNPYTETSGALGVSASAASMHSTQTLLGAALQRAIPVGKLALVPDVKIGWNHEYADTSASLTGGFAGSSGPGFLVQTASLGRNAAEIGAGANLVASRRVSLFVSYTGLISGSGNLQNFSGGVRIAF